MMVGLIPPMPLLHYAEYGNMHFVLPFNCDFYYSYFAESKKFKMLDNGAYETGHPISSEELLDIAETIDADEVVAPDVYMDAKETIRLTTEFVENFSVEHIRVCVVPQGRNVKEFIESYSILKELPIQTIALPVWLDRISSRPKVVEKLRQKGIWERNVSHHLLGLDRVTELLKYPRKLIRSLDTSLPFSLAYYKVFESQRHPRVPFNARFDSMQENLLKLHIRRLMDVARSR